MPQPDQKTSEKNRRRDPRRKSKRSSRVACYRGSLGLGRNLAVSLLDVSEGGARLLVKVELPTGQEVELRLEAVTHGRDVKALGRVVWCVQAADGTWCVGVQLDKPLPYADLQHLTQGL